MNFDINLTASTQELFSSIENRNLSLLNVNWKKEVELFVHNPYVRDYTQISKSYLDNENIPKS
jgi:uncharacterized HAD superfamily protein